MKKKLLLSSVAALTLFAAYNTANAEGVKYGSLGEPLFSEEKLPDVSTIKEAQTKEELEKATKEYKARQNAVNALRESYAALEDAKKAEVEAGPAFEAAKEAYAKAVKAEKEALDTQFDAEGVQAELEAIKETYVNRKAYDKDLLDNTKTKELNDAKKAKEDADKAVATAELNIKNHKLISPISDAPAVEIQREYDLKLIKLEKERDDAKKLQQEKDIALKAITKEVKELKDSIDLADKKIKSLDRRLDEIKVVVGSENEEGKVRGVLVSTFKEEKEQKYKELQVAEQNYLKSTNERKLAQESYDDKLEEAKEVYKQYDVKFDLEEVLKLAKPTGTFVTKFGWNKDEAGNWSYLLNSEGEKAMNQWVNDNGSWYYLGQDGVMKKWWVQVEGTWYYLNGSGAMQTGWLQDNGTWYYLEASGAMKANQWFEVDGKWYHVNASGALSVNTTVDGYNVNENGEWVK